MILKLLFALQKAAQYVKNHPNTRPRVAGRGSAVFIHVARPGFAPTAGCIALDTRTLRRLLARLGPRTRIHVG